MSDLIAGMTMGMPDVNVRMVCRNVKTGEVTREIETHNRVSKFAIYGLIKFINGEFNTTTPDRLRDYIPRYLALGSNIATDRNTQGVTTEVTVNDTRLLNELNYPRIRLTQRNIITNRYNDPYIKLTIKHYIPVSAYVGCRLAEAGLFTQETGNNCWARIEFEGFTKDDATVIDVTWEITIVSMESEKDAYESIDKSELIESMKTALVRIGANYPSIKDLCDEISKGAVIYGKLAVTQNQIDEVTQRIEELTYPLDSFIPILPEPVELKLGDVVKYNISKTPKITESIDDYPCGKYLELNDSAFNMFGIFGVLNNEERERTVIGYARENYSTGNYEFSTLIYDSDVEENGGWMNVNDKGIRSVDPKIAKIITGNFVTKGNVTITGWDWETDWLVRDTGSPAPVDPAEQIIQEATNITDNINGEII